MLVNELFYSLQGEGLLAGVPSVFVRSAGCNLRCTWCDSERTSWRPSGEMVGIDEIVRLVLDFPARHVVLTGGEPLLQPDLAELTVRLAQAGRHVTIETAGTVAPAAGTRADLMSISPKLASSTPADDDPRGPGWRDRHEQRRLNLDVLRGLLAGFDCQLKFVVCTPDDLHEIRALIGQLGDVAPDRVLLMPEGVTPADLAGRGAWVAELCKEHGYRFCPRLHIALYGHTPGT